MAIKKSVAVRNAELDALETVAGTSPKLRIYSGSAPSATSDAATGTMLCEITLPSDWAANASGGQKTKSGTWSGTGAAAGTAGYFRLWDSSVSTGAGAGVLQGHFDVLARYT